MANVSFQNDIMPTFKQYKAQMMWRFDLTNYDDVVANAETIYGQISGPNASMPPAPFCPLPDTVVESFKKWMQTGFTP